MNSKMLMEVSEYLKAQANVMAAVEQLVPPKESTETKPTNIFGNDRSGGLAQHVPPEFNFVTRDNPYGAHESIGSPGWQVNLRSWAAADGKSRNAFVREKGLTPIWPDEKQDWEQ